MAKVSTRADMALIKGAADVGKSMAPADLSGLDKITKAGTDMAVNAIGEIQKIEQEKVDMYDAFTEAANEVELNSGALGDVLYNDTVDFANEAKNNYLTALKAGDQKGMMAAKKAMQQRSTFTQQHKAFITDLAKLQKDGDLSAAQTPEENAYMTAVLKGNYKVEKNDKGEMVFNVNGVKKTNAEFEDMHILKNYTMGKTIGELNGKNKQSSAFDRNSVLNTISQSLPKTEKEFRAALVDDLGGGEGFKDLLIKDKGLDQEALMAIGFTDPNGDGVIDEKEKDNFIAAITDHTNPNFNLDVSKRIMAEKMTQAVENNHTAHWEGVATANATEQLNKRKLEYYKNKLREDLIKTKGKIDIGKEIVKAQITAGEETSVTTSEQDKTVTPPTFKVQNANDPNANIEITRETALVIGEKLKDPASKMFTGSQGTYFKKQDGSYELFEGSDEDVREDIIDANEGIEKYVRDSKDIFEALTKYNKERKKNSGPMGGTGITEDKIKDREGVNQAQQSITTETSKTVTNTNYNTFLDDFDLENFDFDDLNF